MIFSFVSLSIKFISNVQLIAFAISCNSFSVKLSRLNLFDMLLLVVFNFSASSFVLIFFFIIAIFIDSVIVSPLNISFFILYIISC